MSLATEREVSCSREELGARMGWDGMEGAQHPGPETGHLGVPAGDVPGAGSCPALQDECLGFAQERQQIYIFNIELYVYALEKYSFIILFCVYILLFLWSNI